MHIMRRAELEQTQEELKTRTTQLDREKESHSSTQGKLAAARDNVEVVNRKLLAAKKDAEEAAEECERVGEQLKKEVESKRKVVVQNEKLAFDLEQDGAKLKVGFFRMLDD